jgi:hypothetical protein
MFRLLLTCTVALAAALTATPAQACAKASPHHTFRKPMPAVQAPNVPEDAATPVVIWRAPRQTPAGQARLEHPVRACERVVLAPPQGLRSVPNKVLVPRVLPTR